MTTGFDFEMSRDDYAGFMLRHCFRRGIKGILIGVAVIVAFIVVVGGERDPYSLIVPIAAGIGVWLLLIVWTFFNARRIYRDTPSMQQERRVEFDLQGFVITQESGEFRSPWRDIHRWNSDKRALSLWLNQAMLILIPRDESYAAALEAITINLKNSGLAKGKKRKRV